VYHLKRNPTITYYGTKIKSETGPPRVILSLNLPSDTRVKVTLVARPLSRQLRKSCTGVNMVNSRTERVFFLKHCFASTSFDAVREAFSNAYPDKEVPNMTTIHRLVSKFRDTGSVCDRKHVRRRTVLTGETLHNVEETQLLYCKSSLVSAQLGVAFGHGDLHTLPRQTSFCGDFSKKEFIRTTHEAWRSWNNTEQTVAKIDTETLRKVARNTLKRENAFLWEGGGHFQHLVWSGSASSPQTNKNLKKSLVTLMSPSHTNTAVETFAFQIKHPVKRNCF
jgi:hypothetical protein